MSGAASFFGGLLLTAAVGVGLWLAYDWQENGRVERYPDQVRATYLSSCQGAAGPGSESDCRCLLEETEREFTLDEFAEAELAATSSGDLPAELLRPAARCLGGEPPREWAEERRELMVAGASGGLLGLGLLFASRSGDRHGLEAADRPWAGTAPGGPMEGGFAPLHAPGGAAPSSWATVDDAPVRPAPVPGQAAGAALGAASPAGGVADHGRPAPPPGDEREMASTVPHRIAAAGLRAGHRISTPRGARTVVAMHSAPDRQGSVLVELDDGGTVSYLAHTLVTLA